ncbi:sn-glycerol-3-phosphate ABC transporter ATP-binding protein UgpC [Rothia sp. AR01]|uniref:Sn-glycerol-3-phosphate ABC transporter ATP-binding protein UgpC n=1 Tax=Rothia santali TaxID=2949643 RepID=A0A9X2HGN9_9MICC|nr:sn-glycerol-3-phosphate ABC transporter ATP-binding protein UgpC [Rothia santali]MCP3425386.1 sn-glycerol-3-phosphate ABC transporter ATP-binding protein UgpC [Rothia santali]
MAGISFNDVTCRYEGATRASVDHLDLEIADGEFLVLVGPSGCGKSTTLRMLAGLEEVTEGSISIGDQDVTHTAPKDRDIAMVFQNYALYPHMSVRDNIGFSLKIAKYPAEKRNRRIEEAAKLLDLTEYLDRKPKALSGGQRQRVAMGRAIVRQPRAFLMDEPLSNLDAKLRVQTRTQISELTRQLGVTTVYVTHDQTEAMTMGDRVAVLKDGILQQVDTPGRLYDCPANEFVAGFIGSPSMNIFHCEIGAEGARLGGAVVPLPEGHRARLNGTEASVGIRPEDLAVVGEGEGMEVHVELVEELGADAYVYASLPKNSPVRLQMTSNERPAQVIMRIEGRSPIRRFDRLWLAPRGHCHFFDPETGENLAAEREAVTVG